ncbi:MAG: helix-turn-helix domain-containing protein [Candidatus Methanofastidiosia archaeon]
MIGIFNRTAQLYDALANKTRLSILILLKARDEMNLDDFTRYLEEVDTQNLGDHLGILEKAKLIRKELSTYFLTKEGRRRLTELGISKTEALELTKERL